MYNYRLTLKIRGDDSLEKIKSMLTTEIATSMNVKGRVQKVLIKSIITRALKEVNKYESIPSNGIHIECSNEGVTINESSEEAITINIYIIDTV